MKIKNAGCFGLMVFLAFSPVMGFSQVPVEAPEGPAAATGTGANLSPGAAEIVKLAQSGVSDDVMVAYIQKSQAPFNLSQDNVIYLKDLGLSSAVMTAMLSHDSALAGQQPQYNYNQQLYPPTISPPITGTDVPPTEPTVPPDQNVPPPAYDNNPPAEVNYFYNDLSPYGSWVNLPGYGWCWQPSTVVINHDWTPYCDGGHWVYSDCGWFWQSDYSWGWAPFHYGRWHRDDRCGWVWFPGTVWGPAWVTWRTSGDLCGWAPLPPHAVFSGGGFLFNGVHVGAEFDFGLGAGAFTFIGLKDFQEHDLGHRRLPPAEVTRIYHQTTVINNYTVENRTVVNRGIDANRVAAVTHTTIRQVSVRDVPGGATVPHGGTTAVYRHQIIAPGRVTIPIVAQRVDEQHPVIQHRVTPPVNNGGRPMPVNPVTRPAPNTRPQPQQQPQQPIKPGAANERPEPREQNQVIARAQPARPEAPVTTTARRPEETRQVEAQASEPVERSTQVASQTRTEENQVSHVYPPKSARQAAEAHALPPDNQMTPTFRQTAGPSENQRQSQPGNGNSKSNAPASKRNGG